MKITLYLLLFFIITFICGIIVSKVFMRRKNNKLKELVTDYYFENLALRQRVKELEFMVENWNKL